VDAVGEAAEVYLVAADPRSEPRARDDRNPALLDERFHSWDRHSEQEHRRVELFFFPKELGIVPTPAGDNSAAGSQEYPTWLGTVVEQVDLSGKGMAKEVTLLEMHDALLRTDSCVIMPEGEDPGSGEQSHLALTTVGLMASVLRYNEEHPGKKLLVAGHTDTSGTEGHNQALSEERAKVVVSLLTGGSAARREFGELCAKRHDGVDLTQILDWVAVAYGFDCKPSVRDRRPHPTTVAKFKTAYNRHFNDMFGDMDGAVRFSEPVTAVEDESLWSAVYDCYEYNLRRELGVDGDRLRARRKALLWVDDARKSLGFNERFPIDNLGRSDYRSQSNRRVEILMFDWGKEPNLADTEANLDAAVLYLPGRHVRMPVRSGPECLRLRLVDTLGRVYAKVRFSLSINGMHTRSFKTET
jgi:hypothetical protein